MAQSTRAKRNAGDSRERILQATIDLICERGFSGTSVNAVCSEVGVAKTALYWHFGSKDGLLAAVIDRVSAGWVDEIESRVYTAGPPGERLQSLLDGLRDIVENRSHLMRLLFVAVMEQGNVEPKIRDAVVRIRQRTVESISRGFVDTLGFELPDMDLLVHTILSLVEGALHELVLRPDDADLDRLFADFRRTIDLLVADRVSRIGASIPERSVGTG